MLGGGLGLVAGISFSLELLCCLAAVAGGKGERAQLCRGCDDGLCWEGQRKGRCLGTGERVGLFLLCELRLTLQHARRRISIAKRRGMRAAGTVERD